ncbi:MAG: aspartate aminotransferase [Candidatus Marinimicrobia bacterium]|nr:aspartate aminotransferase [Candidatus Neomarinimicrobiota bacterium]|tara:strand:+ start:22074 stop:23267 length:1194 start_codon:yes stop_codon:yes gene_type:complete
MSILASRISRISPSATLQMTALAAELKRLNKPVYNMSVGEPDFATPMNIQEAAKKAIDNNHTRYTPGSGTRDLKEAILYKIKRDNSLEYDLNNVIVSCGAKHSLYNACQALFESGDEVIVFEPYWVSFPDFVSVTGAIPIYVKTNKKKQFEPDFDDLKKKINKKTKGIIINSPSNPTGGVWSNEALLQTLELCNEQDIWVFSDECYEQFVYDGTYHSLAALTNNNSRVLTFQSCSKTYAMTGWRIGYTIGDARVVSAMSKLQGQSTSCPNSIAQQAAVEALVGDQSSVDNMCRTFQKRRDLILAQLMQIKKVECETPNGAFYVFPDFSNYLGAYYNEKQLKTSNDLCMYILDSTGVVTVAGDSFGAPGYIRLSYATSEQTIIKATDLIKKALSKLNF